VGFFVLRYYGAQKTTSPLQNMPRLWQAIFLAQKMGEKLGRGKILL
jgi:hypothetical protein